MFDIVIIGAGPAGSTAALTCARAGLQVAVIDRTTFPRHRPGETLHPGMEPLFERLGVLDQILSAGFHRHRGIWVEWEAPRTFQTYGEGIDGPWTGFQADRSILDDILQKAARNAGAELFLEEQAIDVLLEDGRAVGVRTDRSEHTARCVADASGWRHWLARRLKLPIQTRSPPLFARFGWEDTTVDDDGEPELRATLNGWHWRAPLASGRTAYCHLDAARGSANQPAGAMMQDVTWRNVAPVAGSGYFLLGDAAGVLDPVSSHGVMRAVMAGMFVGYRLDAVHKRVITEDDATEDYSRWHNAFFERDLEELRIVYQRHPHISDLFS
jgi:flavin-dependent dehydrogenase